MTGIIIAAGRGERLNQITDGKPKTLLEIHGKPIIRWIIDDLRAVGVQRFLLVVGFEGEALRHYFGEKGEADITFIENEQWERGNGISVLLASDHIVGDDVFLLTMSDHLIEKKGLNAAMEMRDGSPLLLVDMRLDRIFDIQDATKVMVRGATVVDIGKDIEAYNGVDAGLFLLDRRVFPFLRTCIAQGKDSLTAGIQAMIEQHPLTACRMPEDTYWIDIDSEQAYGDAMKMWRNS